MSYLVSGHEAIVAAMHQATPAGIELELPPVCFTTMDGEFRSWDKEAKTLTVRFPVKREFQNPRQFMQGGFMVAAIDNTLGPLAYLTAPPSSTTQLNTSYIRPVLPSDEFIEVTAEITELTSRHIYLTATARNPAGKTVANVQSTFAITVS